MTFDFLNYVDRFPFLSFPFPFLCEAIFALFSDYPAPILSIRYQSLQDSDVFLYTTLLSATI